MVRVKCVNPACTGPNRTFLWDASDYGGIARPNDPGAVRKLANCPHCGKENYVWVKRSRRPHIVVRKSGKK